MNLSFWEENDFGKEIIKTYSYKYSGTAFILCEIEPDYMYVA